MPKSKSPRVHAGERWLRMWTDSGAGSGRHRRWLQLPGRRRGPIRCLVGLRRREFGCWLDIDIESCVPPGSPQPLPNYGLSRLLSLRYTPRRRTTWVPLHKHRHEPQRPHMAYCGPYHGSDVSPLSCATSAHESSSSDKGPGVLERMRV